MTYEQAKSEAHRRWGAAGRALFYRDPGEYAVGTMGGAKLPNGTYPYGVGASWEEAFTDADRNAAKTGRAL